MLAPVWSKRRDVSKCPFALSVGVPRILDGALRRAAAQDEQAGLTSALLNIVQAMRQGAV